jgi:hypothetical protein
VPNRFDLIYYSFATLTSVGAAGIVPVSGEARSLTVIESILGVLYLAVLIARLMGAYRPPEQYAAHPPVPLAPGSLPPVVHPHATTPKDDPSRAPVKPQ